MNRETLKKWWPEIEAFKNGGEVQWQFDDEPNKLDWYGIGLDGMTLRPDVIYRVKPEQRVIYMTENGLKTLFDPSQNISGGFVALQIAPGNDGVKFVEEL